MNPEATLSPLATNSTIIAANQLSQPTPDPIAIAGLWMGRLDMLSSIFALICTVILGVLALLTWGNIQQKKEAKEQLASITKMSSDIFNLHKQFNEIMGESKKILKSVSNQSENAQNLIKEAQVILESTKEKGAKIENLQTKMEQLSSEMSGTISTINAANASLPFMQNPTTIGYLNRNIGVGDGVFNGGIGGISVGGGAYNGSIGDIGVGAKNFDPSINIMDRQPHTEHTPPATHSTSTTSSKKKDDIV